MAAKFSKTLSSSNSSIESTQQHTACRSPAGRGAGPSGGLARYAALPSGNTPVSRYRHKSISSLRAIATMPILQHPAAPFPELPFVPAAKRDVRLVTEPAPSRLDGNRPDPTVARPPNPLVSIDPPALLETYSGPLSLPRKASIGSIVSVEGISSPSTARLDPECPVDRGGFVHSSPLDDRRHAADVADILLRIAVHEDEVGKLARLD